MILRPLHGKRRAAKLFGDIPTGGCAVDSKDLEQYGGKRRGLQTDANSTKT